MGEKTMRNKIRLALHQLTIFKDDDNISASLDDAVEQIMQIKNLGESSSRLSAVSGYCADKYSHIKNWNIELFDDGIYACTNEHDKGDKCNYKKLSNNELHEIIEYLRNGR